MIYGLYLSATGVLTNSYRQDVIANNLANAETVGFKRSLALFQQRPTEAQTLGQFDATNPSREPIGGGLLALPTFVDHSQGALEATGRNLDVGIHGRGFFAVADKGQTRLTRNGKFMLDREGYLTLADGSGHRVLDSNRSPIALGDFRSSQLLIQPDGTISAGEEVVAQLGLFDVPDPSQLTKLGGTLLGYPDTNRLQPADGSIQAGYIENSNVDPMKELTQLMAAQRQLEANANMIRFQDQTLSKLVNEAGKIG